MRLTQIKLAGFKSFVDPTPIATPGQLVGIVGPNGCGKSNVIDAVRWVLGESKASALRGESMQDVIFNGAGDRKPVGRASVELLFDNSAGRIGGQWGKYAEISIKRVLTRDGDSSYYINNMPVRRRDIHDLFLGTGLGPRAYAIIEQGMISRVVEARPEELRVFLEEAAGVSKYRERRKETEGRLADTRENLARVEDIRAELGHQLGRLEHQAKVAGEYRELEARLAQAQQMLWFSRQQDAVRARERCSAEIAQLTVALERLQADLRGNEARIEQLRAEHYAAGDALHERQGRFYAANSEVSRLEQQLAFARENETRLTQQVAQITEQLGALAAQEQGLAGDRASLDAALEGALAAREQAAAEEGAAREALPALEQAFAEALRVASDVGQRIHQTEQALRVAETRRDNLVRAVGQLDTRLARVDEELASLAAPVSDEIGVVAEQLGQEKDELAGKERALAALQADVQSLQERHRAASQAWTAESRRLADLEAREKALAALQARVGHGGDKDAWLEGAGLAQAPQLWRWLDVDAGWNDALEAVLRERLEALEVDTLDRAGAWDAGADAPPVRLALFAAAPARHGPEAGGDALIARVRLKRADLGRLIADALHGVRCRASLAEALADRDALALGEAFVTPAGHLVGAQSVTLFKPDGELHGVLERQRELDELAGATAGAREAVAGARAALDALDVELRERQQAYHAEGLALSSQQRRCHDLELELLQLQQAAEAAGKRRAQLAQERADVEQQLAAERGQHDAVGREIADLQSRLHDVFATRDAARVQRSEAEVARERGRERLRVAERAVQEAGFAERSARDRLADLERRREALALGMSQQRALLGQLDGERQSIDWTPVEEALQRQLAARGEAEQSLAAARERLEAAGADLRAAEEARMAIEQQLDPARQKIQDMQLKEQAAALSEAQFAEQLAQVHADTAALPEALKAFGPKSQLPGEIERLQGAIAELGAVNLAALDELSAAQERKSYLDRQAADLVEAMTTLETAIRQIDRESRELLQQTFAAVNENFGRLFPALFGGGQARLVLTGEEILDSGVQVIAQPPGKRNTSIHLLSGGEKALTATSLVFALFQLNPAPFCLLDEVDAPLDDSNTERFCRMVQEMSGQTQFLYISHNKITMEMAHQLIGITMPDPGISRVVAVDIADAVELARTGAAVAAAA
ncbi:MAG: chromosome partition protein Smc [Betaproteobacteria bacterium]|nr:MAG: chromosome partition protein Smc [Betaproteobacteria bacterium]